MAKKKGDILADTGGGVVKVNTGDEMPDPVEGGKGHELNPGGVFDPNAARRLAEGRGPGLMDSEILQPAHWPQPPEGSVEEDILVEKLKVQEAEEKAAAKDDPKSSDAKPLHG